MNNKGECCTWMSLLNARMVTELQARSFIGKLLQLMQELLASQQLGSTIYDLLA